MTSLNFTIVPRCPWANELMFDLVTMTEHIEGMDAFGIEEMRELSTVIGLNGFRSVTKIRNGALDKIDGGITAVFLIGIDKAFS